MNIKALGIDLAKNVFQLCAINQAGKVLFNRQVRRAKFRSTIANLEPTTIWRGATQLNSPNQTPNICPQTKLSSG